MTTRKHTPALTKRVRLAASDLYAGLRREGVPTTVTESYAYALVTSHLRGTVNKYSSTNYDKHVRLIDVAVYIARHKAGA